MSQAASRCSFDEVGDGQLRWLICQLRLDHAPAQTNTRPGGSHSDRTRTLQCPRYWGG